MSNLIRILILTTLTLVALLAAACGGDNDANNGNSGPAGGGDAGADSVFGDFGENELYVSAGTEVLTASAGQFGQEISSMEGDLQMDASAAGIDFSITADFAFKSPDSMYMSMDMSGDDGSGFDISEFGSMQMLVRDNTMYMKMAFFGPDWIKMSFDELGEDAFDIEEMLESSSAFDYEHLIGSLDGVEFVGEETIDGRTLLRYSVTLDVADAITAFAETLESSDAGVTDSFTDISGPVTMDVWIGKSDFLPYLMTLDGDLTSPTEGTMSLDMTLRVTGYNTDVHIPDAPANAVGFEELFGDLFGDMFEGLAEE